ncbi:MAG: transglutaminase-like domain-containing protein [Kiritimatiellae bacterium]|nr:transglutaminase-like domain-containing protein [Kiritimatiellia bacterium]
MKNKKNTLQTVFTCCLALVVCLPQASCKRVPENSRYGVVTADIADAIKQHIDEQSRLGDGTFNIPFEGKELKLRLVRIHFEYLAVLTPTLHFACVDLAAEDGDFYDVDFYLEGRPGAMKVTETTVHKINGQPFYLREQQPDKSWARVPVDGASHQLLGVIKERDEFDFTYEATLPRITGRAKIWLPMPQSDRFQSVTVKSLQFPATHKIINDTAHNNQVVFMELGPEHSNRKITMVFHVIRLEKNAYSDDQTDITKHLTANTLIPQDERFDQIVRELLKNSDTDLIRARAIYDHIIDHMRYMKYGEGWGKGDAVRACSSLYGNCTDFHSYFIALARAAGIPARFAIGAALPSERNDGGVDGYHCWAEFYADGKWWPVDISEANKYTELGVYYFGHHPANRFEFTVGRDLVVNPAPASGPINFLAYPLLEIEGQPLPVERFFSFERLN